VNESGIWNDEMLAWACSVDSRYPLVRPFEPANVNPASIDLRLGTSYRLAGRETWGDEQHMDAAGIVLQPGQFVLCSTLETVHIPPHACAALFSKSSTGRMGLEHLHAGWIDPGFRGQLTLELHNVAPWPVALVPGKRYLQMVVYDLVAPAVRDYSETGRYQNQTGATPAREVR
jgi:dCTP deaminase